MEAVEQQTRPVPSHVVVGAFATNGAFSSGAFVAFANSVWEQAISQETLSNREWTEFAMLVEAWKAETINLSSIAQVLASEPYRKILSMRERAVPLIIRQLKVEGTNPYHWWGALRELTNENPVPDNLKGDIRAMSRCWIEWARNRYGVLGR
jgi:hypothetical protein